VVYFAEDGNVIKTAELRTSVGIKEMNVPVTHATPQDATV